MNKKMKKLGLYTMALLSVGLVGCNQDFDTEFVPQTNPQESLLQTSDVSVATSSATSINLADFINEEEGIDKPVPIGTVSVKEGSMPANTILKAEVEFSKSADFDNSIILNANSLDGTNEISVQASTLQDVYFNNITRNPAETDLYIRTVLYTVTGSTADAVIGKPGENYYAERTVKFTPLNKVQISSAYYLIGGPNDWTKSAADRLIKFNHSGKDVYDDPVFTVVFDAKQDDDTWFAFGDDAACDAIGEGDWTKLFGIVGGDSETKEGRFDFRYNLGSDNSFKVAKGAKKIQLIVNMMDFTFTVKTLDFDEYLYEAGVNNSWGGTEQPLYCADGNGTYTGFFYAKEDSWTDGKGAFKFRGAADNWDEGNYGTGTLNADGLSGTLIDDGGSGNVMPEPGFYRADVNLADMTFKLIPIKSVFVVGSAVGNDWDKGVEMTYNFDKLCWECDATFTEAGVIKFKGNGTWDTEDGNWGGTADNIINGSNDNIPVSVSGDVHIEFYPLCETKSYCKITKK
jgi:hypothetical protein